MTKAVTVSLCMIVKNEARHIERCLESVKDQVDEMIIVDTGSEDDTKEKCLQLGAKVIPHTWTNHFAEARNKGLAEATGDWIMWMDADEQLEALPAGELKRLLSDVSEPIQMLHLINFTEDPPREENAFHIGHSRLFRNHLGFSFMYAIHETLNVQQVFEQHGKDAVTIGRLPIKLYHYGYMDNGITTGKYERNMKMLQQAKKNQEDNPWLDYHIASEHYRMKDYTQAFDAINESIRSYLNRNILPPSLVYKMKYATMLAAGSVETAWPGIERAIELYPDYTDLHFYKGVILMAREDFEEANAAFDQCLQLGEGNLNHLSLYGSGSFLPLHYKGIIQEQLDRPDEALLYYKQALEHSHHFPAAHEAIARLSATDPV